MIAAILLSVATLADFPIDTVRVDLDDRAVGIYGCQTHLAEGLSAHCTGSVALPVLPVYASGPLIDFAATAPGFMHWSTDGKCRLLSATVGEFGEAQYRVYCGVDFIFGDGFEEVE